MITFHFVFMSTIQLFFLFIVFVAIVYITKCIDLWLDSRKKEHFTIRFINLLICDMASNLAIIMPFLIVAYIFIMTVILICL